MLQNKDIDCMKVAIINFHFSRCNYGSLMVPYALSQVVQRLGYHPYNVNYIPTLFVKELYDLGYSPARNIKESYYLPNCPFIAFREKFLNLTDICYSDNDLVNLACQFNKFISGSDQVWRNGPFDNRKYMFDWVFGQKLMISYAASFGFNKYFGIKKDVNKIKNLLSRFDAVSVREHSGLDICRNQFDLDCVQTLDPTLLLDEYDYDVIIDDDTTFHNEDQYIGYMLLDDSEVKKIESEEVLFELKRKYKFINVIKDEYNNNRTFSDWLKYIKNARFIITNSFHGSVFSIIFKKQFICISRDFEANSRIESLFKTLEINNNLFVNDMLQANSILDHQIDYDKVYTNLSRERKNSIEFLKNKLSLPLSTKL